MIARLDIRFLIAIFLSACSLCIFTEEHLQAAQEKPRFALLIGNSAYSPKPGGADVALTGNHAGTLPYLPNACNDVRGIGDALVAKAKWAKSDVEVLCDADNDKMGSALNRFVDRFENSQAPTAILYFAGHGVQVGGKAYAFGVNAMPDIVGTANFYRNNTTATLFPIDAQDLQASIIRVGKILDGGALLIVMDACRDNPLIPSLKQKGISDIEKVASLATPMGVESAFSTSENESAVDGSGKLSPYAEAFIEHIGEDASINDVLDEIATDVYKKTDNGVRDPQQPNRSGHFRQPPRHCFPECPGTPLHNVPPPLGHQMAPTVLSEVMKHVAGAGAALDKEFAHDDDAGNAVESSPTPQPERSALPPSVSLNLDVFYCAGGPAEAGRVSSAQSLIADLRSAPARTTAGEASGIKSIRLRSLPPEESSKADFEYAGNVIEFDQNDPKSVDFKNVLTSTSKLSLKVVNARVPVPGYMSVYFCDGVKLAQSRARVFIQIAARQQEFTARRLIPNFESSEKDVVVAEDVELVSLSPNKSSVRYYFAVDEQLAKNLASIVSAQTGYDAHAQRMDVPATATITPGLLEVWFGKEVDGQRLQANAYKCNSLKSCARE